MSHTWQPCWALAGLSELKGGWCFKVLEGWGQVCSTLEWCGALNQGAQVEHYTEQIQCLFKGTGASLWRNLFIGIFLWQSRSTFFRTVRLNKPMKTIHKKHPSTTKTGSSSTAGLLEKTSLLRIHNWPAAWKCSGQKRQDLLQKCEADVCLASGCLVEGMGDWGWGKLVWALLMKLCIFLTLPLIQDSCCNWAYSLRHFCQ